MSLYSKSDSKNISGFYPLFSGVSDEKNKFNEMSFKCLKVFAKLFNKKTLFIVNKNFQIPEIFKIDDIPIVKINELEKIDDEEEFIELIQES